MSSPQHLDSLCLVLVETWLDSNDYEQATESVFAFFLFSLSLSLANVYQELIKCQALC